MVSYPCTRGGQRFEGRTNRRGPPGVGSQRTTAYRMRLWPRLRAASTRIDEASCQSVYQQRKEKARQRRSVGANPTRFVDGLMVVKFSSSKQTPGQRTASRGMQDQAAHQPGAARNDNGYS